MIKWRDIRTSFWYVLYPLYPILITLSILAASRGDWLVMGASLVGFQITTMILVGRAIAREVTIGAKRLEHLISKSKDDKSTNENPA